MAKKYIQIKDSVMGEAYNNRSFLVSSEDEHTYAIKKDAIFIPKEHAIDVEGQRLNLELETVYATLAENWQAISRVEVPAFKEKPKGHKVKVVDHCVENGILYLYFGEEFDTDEEEAWYKARRFVLHREPLKYDEDFYSKKYSLFKKQVENIVTQEFVEGWTKDLFIMKDVFTKLNGEASIGYSLRSGDNFVSSFGEFQSVEKLKASPIFKLAIEGKL